MQLTKRTTRYDTAAIASMIMSAMTHHDGKGTEAVVRVTGRSTCLDAVATAIGIAVITMVRGIDAVVWLKGRGSQ